MVSNKDVKRVKGIIDNKAYIGPKRVNIHLNNYCNLNCIFCWYHSRLIKKIKPKRRDFDYDVLKKVIDDCSKIGVETIDLEGDGEPFLYPHMGELLRYIDEKGMKVKTYTNALFQDFDLANLRYVDYLDINFSAATPEVYGKIHCNGKKDIFKKVLKNLNNISKIKKTHKKLDVILTFIINEINYCDMEKIFALGSVMGFDKINFKMFEATEDTKEILLSDDAIKNVILVLEKISKKKSRINTNAKEIIDILRNKKLNKKYSIKWGKKHNNRLFYFEGDPYKDHGCYLGWFAAYIDLDYRVIAPCDNVGIVSLGRVDKDKFKDIWFSREYIKLREEARDKLDIQKEIWQECRYCHNVAFNKKIYGLLERRNSNR